MCVGTHFALSSFFIRVSDNDGLEVERGYNHHRYTYMCTQYSYKYIKLVQCTKLTHKQLLYLSIHIALLC